MQRGTKKHARAFLFLYSIRETSARFSLRTSDRVNRVKKPNEPLAVINEKRFPFRPALSSALVRGYGVEKLERSGKEVAEKASGNRAGEGGE